MGRIDWKGGECEGFRESTIVMVTLRVDECIFGMEVYTLDRTMTTFEPCLSIMTSSDVTVSWKSPLRHTLISTSVLDFQATSAAYMQPLFSIVRNLVHENSLC